MTEADWLACDDLRRMLAFVGPAATAGKLASFASAFDRLLPRWPGLECPPSPPAGRAPWLFGAGQPAPVAAAWDTGHLAASITGEVLWRADALLRGEGGLPPEWRRGLLRLWCDLLRDIFAPFRSVALAPSWLSANGSAARKLAASIYGGAAFEELPVLADALEDAGCAAPDLLGHLRGPGPHVRGCWALDLILSKE